MKVENKEVGYSEILKLQEPYFDLRIEAYHGGTIAEPERRLVSATVRNSLQANQLLEVVKLAIKQAGVEA